MKVELRAKVTFEWEYEVESEEAESAMFMDLQSAEDDILLFLDACPNAPSIDITIV